MRELGIDLSERRPQRLTPSSPSGPTSWSRWAAATPARTSPGKRYLDWELPDPKGRPVDEVRALRDDIARRVDALVAELDRAPS